MYTALDLESKVTATYIFNLKLYRKAVV